MAVLKEVEKVEAVFKENLAKKIGQPTYLLRSW